MHFCNDRLIGERFKCWVCGDTNSNIYTTTHMFACKVFGNSVRRFENVHCYVHLCADCSRAVETEEMMNWKRPSKRIYFNQFLLMYEGNKFDDVMPSEVPVETVRQINPERITIIQREGSQCLFG